MSEEKISPVSVPRKPRSFMSGLLHLFFKKGSATPAAGTARPFSHVKDVFSNLCFFRKLFQGINKKGSATPAAGTARPYIDKKKKKKKEEKENLKEEAPPVKIEVPRSEPGEEKEPVTLPVVKPGKKIPAKAKARLEKPKKKQVKKPRSPQVDKKGFRVLTNEHDLYRLFTEKKPGGDRDNEDEDFARLLAAYQDDRHHRRMMRQKLAAEEKARTGPIPVGERLKIYPGPQVDLDLHGYTADRAEAQTEAFLRGVRQNDILTVRIIVGKGLHSEGKAVLPEVVEKKIIELKRRKWVLSFKWEKKDKRKSGALIVYLIPG